MHKELFYIFSILISNIVNIDMYNNIKNALLGSQYFWKCEGDLRPKCSRTNVLVYINVLNLKEEEVLILLKNDGGTLAK